MLFELIKPILHVTPTPLPSPTPDVAGISIIGLFFILFWLIGILLYFTPALIAAGRHRQILAIFVLNLFLGWTIVGWVGALVWACTED